MNRRFPLSLKLLLIILPVVCLPVAIVGYISLTTAVDHVKSLARQDLMLKVQTRASEIMQVMDQARQDLSNAQGLTHLSDYYLTRSLGLASAMQNARLEVEKSFWDILTRSPAYLNLAFLDANGQAQIKVGKYGAIGPGMMKEVYRNLTGMRVLEAGELEVSRAFSLQDGSGPVMLLSRPWYQPPRLWAGTVLLVINFGIIEKKVKNLAHSPPAESFLLDQFARAVVHSFLPPYSLNLDDLLHSPFKETAQAMTFGDQGWSTYQYKGEEWGAAYAPIRNMAWSLALAAPHRIYARDAELIRAKVYQVGMVALALSIAAASILAHIIVRPVRDLVRATKRLTGGDLAPKIPVKSHDELGELAESFNEMLGSLTNAREKLIKSQRMANLGELSAGIAHEVRNPLNAIKGAVVYLQMLDDGNEELNQCAGLILEEIRRLDRFVTECLALGRNSQPEKSPLDLNFFFSNLSGLFAKQAPGRRHLINIDLPEHLPRVPMDHNQMEQVFLNLVINAMEAMPGGGTVEITATMGAEGWVRITVGDQGPGVSAEYLDRIWEPFFTTKKNGTGLGLPICLHIVEEHGGRMRLEIPDHGGLLVYVNLPLN